MKRVINLSRYLLSDTLKAIVVFYSILIVMIAGSGMISLYYGTRGFTSVRISGLEFTSVIFLFVAGLNSFKPGFLFAMANGFTRRQYHLAVMAALTALATAMAVVDVAINQTARAMLPTVIQFWPQGYEGSSAAALALWHWMMNLEAAAVGLCITMAFYRLNTLGKWILGLSPMIVSVLLQQLGPAAQQAVSRAQQWLMGISPDLGAQPNALLGALSMALSAAALFALARLLIRGAAVKEQER